MMRTSRALVEELVDAYNAKSLDRVLAFYTPDARFWDPFHRDGVVGREAIGEVILGLFESFPDERMTIETLVADEAYAVAELRSTGVARSGEPFDVQFTEVYEVADGRIASCRVYLDTRALPGPD